jgi:transposase InsO family protein
MPRRIERRPSRLFAAVGRSESVAKISDVRWATDATYLWTRFDGLAYVNAVIDCADRECTGLNVSQASGLSRAREVKGIQQEFILPHTPRQNGVAESFKAKAAITAGVKHYNEFRPLSRLGYQSPTDWRQMMNTTACTGG